MCYIYNTSVQGLMNTSHLECRTRASGISSRSDGGMAGGDIGVWVFNRAGLIQCELFFIGPL